MRPNFNEEKRLWKQGCKTVVGLDEAGRGPLAGPVVAGAVTLQNPKSKNLNSKQIKNPNNQNPKRFKNFNFKNLDLFRNSNLEFRILINNVKDSKQLSAKKRGELYQMIIHNPDIRWGLGVVSEKTIDKINILQATKLAMAKAVKKLQMVNGKLTIDYLILDGRMRLNLPWPQKSIVKADEKVFSCALASILAKVTRDRIMTRYHKKYPHYRFDLHKGYPTRAHIKLLKKYGPSKIHRLSFGPVVKVQNSKRKA